jgi:ectoine hydroxylase-related dioxygenase (phytanoyl-CoA dioxygenase family)
MQDLLDHFRDNGYVVLHEILSPEDIARVNDGIDADRTAHPDAWKMGPRPGFDSLSNGGLELLHRTDAVDHIVHHPGAIPLVKAILGEGCQCSGLSYMQRQPCLVEPPEDIDGGDPLALSRNWHREDRGCVEGADENDYYAPSIQIIYCFDDVDEGTHCTSIIPESADTKRALPRTEEGNRIDDRETGYLDPDKPTWKDSFGREFGRRIGRVDVHGKAGTALVFNNASWHTASIRKTERIRRAVHVRYRQPEPVRSTHGLHSPFKSVSDFQAALPKRASIGVI